MCMLGPADVKHPVTGLEVGPFEFGSNLYTENGLFKGGDGTIVTGVPIVKWVIPSLRMVGGYCVAHGEC